MPVAVLVLVALVVLGGVALGLATALGGDPDVGLSGAVGGGPTPTVADYALLERAGGPLGSRPVTLANWRYRDDPKNHGRDEGWHDGDWEGREVTVPYSPNAADLRGEAGVRAHAGAVGWFAREINAPVAGTYAVRFESAHHRAQVFVDGEEVVDHTGVYEPFTARVGLTPGVHTIAVRIDWRGPGRQAQQGWGRGWFNYGGLNRPVTLVRVGPSELTGLGVRTTILGEERVRVQVSVRVGNNAATRRIGVQGRIIGDPGRVRLRFRRRPQVTEGQTATVRASVVLRRPRLWSPERPRLYDLEVEIPGEASLRHPVGLREVRWDRGALQLNRRPLVLRGAALPPDVRGRGDAFTGADEEHVVRELVATGANATRSQLPLSDSMLARLDEAGILVWQKIGPWEPAGAWHSDTVAEVVRARDRALRTADAHRWHASILAWSLTNEVAGQGQPEEQVYVSATARDLHALDPTRPVAADLWSSRLTRTDGPLFYELDAIGITDYTGWYEKIDAGDEEQAELVRERLSRARALFPDKPIVVAELGAVGTARIPPADFGGMDFQAELLARRIGVLATDPLISGALVWSLRDYALRPDFRGGSVLKLRPDLNLTPGLNEKGLYDFAGRPKPALASVRDAFAAAAAAAAAG